LLAELVAGEPEDLEALRFVLLVELLEALVLRGEATPVHHASARERGEAVVGEEEGDGLAGDIDDQDYFAL